MKHNPGRIRWLQLIPFYGAVPTMKKEQFSVFDKFVVLYQCSLATALLAVDLAVLLMVSLRVKG